MRLTKGLLYLLMFSLCIMAVNALPNVTSPEFNNSAPKTDQNIMVNTTYLSNVTNGTVYFRWYVNSINVWNETISSLNNTLVYSNISSSNYSKNDQINVSVYAIDNVTTSATKWSSTITVNNTGPSYVLTAASNNSYVAADSVILNITITDIDNDNLTVWFTGNGTSLNTSYANSSYNWSILSSNRLYNWSIIVGDGAENITTGTYYFVTDYTVPYFTYNLSQTAIESESAGTAKLNLTFNTSEIVNVSWRFGYSCLGSSSSGSLYLDNNFTFSQSAMDSDVAYHYNITITDNASNQLSYCFIIITPHVNVHVGGSGGGSGGYATQQPSPPPSEPVITTSFKYDIVPEIITRKLLFNQTNNVTFKIKNMETMRLIFKLKSNNFKLSPDYFLLLPDSEMYVSFNLFGTRLGMFNESISVEISNELGFKVSDTITVAYQIITGRSAGEPCKSDNECYSGTCNNLVCQKISQVNTMDLKTIFFIVMGALLLILIVIIISIFVGNKKEDI